MELVAQLEEKFDKLLSEINDLKEYNQLLREEVETEKQTRQDIESRIDTLLGKIQNELKE
ncbi:cell division protein ZapB [Pseudodesulfovibrio sp. JC047]|uniref:cell division protein ZapB n=1 Tax=Pseudodesulfovibrio sp. JC047 TaxID=2683199 RepID=UPI0013D09E9C|nr:cell division protein ZapB [Pseudodesulfovibrio sp. JC047]NDV20080.1 cell division protein ZapB [Pseudodesulfovibrio sp. JC047]